MSYLSAAQGVLGLIVGILGAGGVLGLLTFIRQRKREPLEQEQIAATTDNLAIQSLQISHAAMHDNLTWMQDQLNDTRTQLEATIETLSDTRAKQARTDASLRKLRALWGAWWEDLYHRWHEHRLRDEPPPRPDQDCFK